MSNKTLAFALSSYIFECAPFISSEILFFFTSDPNSFQLCRIKVEIYYFEILEPPEDLVEDSIVGNRYASYSYRYLDY